MKRNSMFKKLLVGIPSNHFIIPFFFLWISGWQFTDFLSICYTPQPHSKYFFFIVNTYFFNDTAIFVGHIIAWFYTTLWKENLLLGIFCSKCRPIHARNIMRSQEKSLVLRSYSVITFIKQCKGQKPGV